MPLHRTVKSTYLSSLDSLSRSRLFDYKWLVEQELDSWKTWIDLPVSERVALWRRGFTSPNGVLYDFETHDPEAYVSELQRYRLYRALNGDHRYLIDDKLSQHWMLSEHERHRPTAFGVVDRGYIHEVAGTEFDGGPKPVSEWVFPTLRRESKLVLKQLRGLGGKEVIVLAYDDGSYSIDGVPADRETVRERVVGLSEYLATEYVSQHDYADALYQDAANTIRVLTLWDDRRRELLVPMAVQRVGTDRSRPVDNWSVGGLSARIERSTGRLTAAARLSPAGVLEWYDEHPDTGTPIEGVTVPRWDDVLATVERIARENTNIPMIGWDVLLSENGTPVVLEANTGTDLDLMQVHRPLLDDPAVAAVVSQHLQ